MFKYCIHLLKAENEQVSYCLKFKSGLERCPSKCGYYSQGPPGDITETRRKQINFECLYLARVNNELKIPNYVCNLMNLQNPSCKDCRFPEYAGEEVNLLHI